MNKQLALVTGGSSGLGAELARGLLERGKDVALIAREEGRLRELKRTLSEQFHENRISVIPGSVADEQHVHLVFNFLRSQELPLAYLFNVAGLGRFGDPDAVTRQQIEEVFEGNLVGLMLMASQALALMNEQGGGTIVNVLSTAAQVGRPKEAVYCAAKWGARGFSTALQVATKGTPVTVTTIYPGGMNTPFWSPECGLSPDVESFMNPRDVAHRILDAVDREDSAATTDLTINRKS